MKYEIEYEHGKYFYLWQASEKDDPTWWICFEYDHGPFCRLCRRLDMTIENIKRLDKIDNLARGWTEGNSVWRPIGNQILSLR